MSIFWYEVWKDNFEQKNTSGSFGICFRLLSTLISCIYKKNPAKNDKVVMLSIFMTFKSTFKVSFHFLMVFDMLILSRYKGIHDTIKAIYVYVLSSSYQKTCKTKRIHMFSWIYYHIRVLLV